MTVSAQDHDPLITAWMLCPAVGKGEQALYLDMLKGRIPPADARHPQPGTKAGSRTRAWRLSTLRAWNPDVAARCAAIAAVLERIPLKAA